jgi:hypothetical protein
MSRASLYLGLALFGLAVQLAVFGWFLADEGLDLGELVEQATESPMAWLALTDVLLSAAAFLVWMPREARRTGVEQPWRYALATAGGLCFALPLFLSARARRLEASR